VNGGGARGDFGDGDDDDDVIRDPILICYLLIASPLYAGTSDWPLTSTDTQLC